MFRGHKYKIIIVTGVVLLVLLLIGTLIYFLFSDALTKQKEISSVTATTNAVSLINDFENPTNYFKNAQANKDKYSSKTYDNLFGKKSIDQYTKLSNEYGFESSFKLEDVEVIEKKDNYIIYRLSGTTTVSYTKTNETYSTPESFIVKTELIDNKYIITDFYQEDDVPDI